MFVGTDDGLLYRLYFGRVFTGSDQELEIGLNADDEADKKRCRNQTKQGDKESEGDKASRPTPRKTDPEATGKPGRYVFVRVNFDPSLLGEALDRTG